MLLLPVTTSVTVEWKIWILSTFLEQLDSYPENQELLNSPGRRLGDADSFEMHVFIIGGGNA